MACQVCTNSNAIQTQRSNKRIYEINCPKCGLYYVEGVSPNFISRSYDLNSHELQKLSFLLRHNSEFRSPISITPENIEVLIDSFTVPKDLLKRIENLILYIYKHLNNPADEVTLDSNVAPIVYTNSSQEFMYYVGIAANDFNYIKFPHNSAVQLTSHGWEFVKTLLQNQSSTKKAFVAMWFSNEVNEAWEKGLFPALDKLGYDPLRIDKKEHNDKIDDHIIAEIRKSGLLIADFTGNRNGVYFEAGFAMGLGIPVIWTCHKGHIDNVHFDTRQYNHIVWETPEELREKLTYRIEATIPNRPKPRSEDSSLRSE